MAAAPEAMVPELVQDVARQAGTENLWALAGATWGRGT
jgi:hypothetical protein